MNKISLRIALEEQEYNAKLALKNPEKQKEFLDEYMYSDPNNYKEMKELYEYYGFKYSLNLWAVKQNAYNEIEEKEGNK